MANEIYATVSLTARKNSAEMSYATAFNQDMAGDDFIQTTQLVGTSAELVSFGEITGAPTQCLIRNLDATNYVEFGGDSGLTVFKLKLLPGKSMLIPLQSGTLYALANTAAVRILILATEA